LLHALFGCPIIMLSFSVFALLFAGLAATLPVDQQNHQEHQLEARQPATAATPPLNGVNYPDTFCAYHDFSDLDTALLVWDDWNVGYWFGYYLHDSTFDPPDTDWPSKLVQAAFPDSGAGWVENCGNPNGGTCASPIGTKDPCRDMAAAGYGYAFYILNALQTFHENLVEFNTMLTNIVLHDLLDIKGLVTDFSAPKSFSGIPGYANLTSAAIFLIAGTLDLTESQ